MDTCAPPEEVTSEIDQLLGDANVSMDIVDARVRARYGERAIVWEGDAATFQYVFVGAPAVEVLGYPVARWLREPTFWADIVVFEHDRDDAVSYCAMATALKRHHVFDYRARASDGRVVWFRDYVKVLLGPRNVPQRLRGFMVEVSEVYTQITSPLRAPTREQLSALSA